MQKSKLKKQKVIVAMSGGVDSSVSAVLLKKQGYDVIGVFMRNWSDSPECPWVQDQYDARRVAEILKIPFYTFNFEKEYKESVVDYFFREYQAGSTPNPDVMCNKTIKFGVFLKEARKLGADYIATGHYARIKSIGGQEDKRIRGSAYRLLRGLDKNKDQSYFLWTLTQEQLKHTLFPIGELTKPHVRYLAEKFGLPNAKKKDSQGICFIGPVNVTEFLKTKIGSKKGKVVAQDGKEIGEHEGVWFYTVGQRHGFGGGGGLPLYVVEKDQKTNTLVVAPEDDHELYQKEFTASDINRINPNVQFTSNPQFTSNAVRCQTRYRQIPVHCQVKKIAPDKVKVILKEPVRAITSGQSVVFYKGSEVLGGGIIQ